METIPKGRLHRIGIQNENPLTIHRSYGFIAVVAAVIIYLFLQILRMYVLARSASMLVTEGTPLAVGSRETVGFMTFLTIARAAGFFGVLAIIVLSLVPGTYRPHTGLPGVAEHFIAYCSTAFAFALGFGRTHPELLSLSSSRCWRGRWRSCSFGCLGDIRR